MSNINHPIELLLSDEYVKFSQRIAEIHAWKKSLKEDFKKKYDEYQSTLHEIDGEANVAQQRFEEWKSTQTKKGPKTPGAEKDVKSPGTEKDVK